MNQWNKDRKEIALRNTAKHHVRIYQQNNSLENESKMITALNNYLTYKTNK